MLGVAKGSSAAGGASRSSRIWLDVGLRACGRREQHIVYDYHEYEGDDAEDDEVGRPLVPDRRNVLLAEPFVHELHRAANRYMFFWTAKGPRDHAALMLIYGQAKSRLTPRDRD